MQIIRCDPSSATGYAPAELVMGRKVVYPFELEKRDIDMTGTELTMSLAVKLQEIHDRSFATAHKKVLKTQAKYKQKYDKRNKAKAFEFKIGSKIQYKRYVSSNTLSKKTLTAWVPLGNFYLICDIDKEKKKFFFKPQRVKD